LSAWLNSSVNTGHRKPKAPIGGRVKGLGMCHRTTRGRNRRQNPQVMKVLLSPRKQEK
jgi:hypothetical protein